MNKEKYIRRNISIEEALSKKSVLLLGPRQTGKTSFFENQLDNLALVWDLRSSRTRRLAQNDPSVLYDEIEIKGITSESGIVVIDEIQKVPELLDEVHRLIENKGIHFLLTGSSARKLKKQGVNLLGGRATAIEMFPLTFLELSSKEQTEEIYLDDILYGGMLPGVWNSDIKDDFLNDYVDTYLDEEIAAEAIIRNLPAFSNFLQFAALSSGEEINYSNIARDVGMSKDTISGWYKVLEDTLVGFSVCPWKKSTKRKASSISKFYLFDVGITRFLSTSSKLEPTSTIYGRLFENYIAIEIKTYLSYNKIREPLTFWRTQRGTYEVDFLIGDSVAIEVKASMKINEKQLQGLRALEEEKHFNYRIVVCREEAPRKLEDGIIIYPWKLFLKHLYENRFL
ncbi:MAG: ATP-binding protein [Sphaerochaetaceae bacterium]|nr:ATP-binding protein [Sphaerochaetaceae bacterium]